MDKIVETLGLNFKVLIVQVVAFLVVFWVLAKFLFGRIGGFIAKRESEIKGSFDEIEKKTRDVERLTEEYRARVQKIEVEAQQKIQASVQEGLKLKNEILEQAQAEGTKERERAKQQIQIEKDKALREIREHVVRLTLEATQKLVGSVVTPEVHGRLVQGYLDELEKVNRLQ